MVDPQDRAAVLGWATNDKGKLVPVKGDDPAFKVVEDGKVVGWRSREIYAPMSLFLEGQDLLPGAVGGYETENGTFVAMPAGTYESDLGIGGASAETGAGATLGFVFHPIGKFCMKWKTKLADSKPGTGDDIMNDGYNVFGQVIQKPRPAKNAQAQIWRKVNSTWFVLDWSGTLDENGCTDMISLQSNTEYRLTLIAIVRVGLLYEATVAER